MLLNLIQFLKEKFSKRKSCVCEDTFVWNEEIKQCEGLDDCNPACLTCFGYLVNQCIRCKGKKILTSEKTCECPKYHFYEFEEIKDCVPCHESCQTCKGTLFNQCLSCNKENTGNIN